MMRNLCARVLASSAAIGTCCAVASAQITIPTVTIGNPGNAADPFAGHYYGPVEYRYDIGQTEVTNAQYTAFLNAVAAEDTHKLYDVNMANAYGGIIRSGISGSRTYSAVSGREHCPVNYVSFWDACRFANWLHNGQPSGPQTNSTTEDGAYTLTPDGISANTVVRNANWRWAVTSENEWYKAAYHQPATQGGDADDYWFFVTSSNSVPTPSLVNTEGVHGNTVPVGSYPANFYGTFDMGGNVTEWNEARIAVSYGYARGVRGGSFQSSSNVLRADVRGNMKPVLVDGSIGFRVTRAHVLCEADYNADTIPDVLDFLDFMDDFGSCTNLPVPCGQFGNPDLNGDTTIDVLDFLDFLDFLDAFGQGC